MKTHVNLLISGLLLCLPLAASAATDDASYCRALASKYDDLVANRGGARGATQTGIETSVALDQCKNGNPAGIPVLEQKLRNLKIELPPRT